MHLHLVINRHAVVLWRCVPIVCPFFSKNSKKVLRTPTPVHLGSPMTATVVYALVVENRNRYRYAFEREKEKRKRDDDNTDLFVVVE